MMTVERASLEQAAKDCGALMRAFRRSKSLRQIDLAERLGVPQGTISRWERGDRIPRDYFRKRIMRELEDTTGVIFRPLGVTS